MPGSGVTQGPGGTPALEIRVRQVDIPPSRLDGLALRSAVSLSASHPQFGGFSGLLMDGHRLIAVTDQGWWLLADMADGPDGLRPAKAGFAPMRGEDGETFDKAGGDAEGLAIRDGVMVVSFEHDHRIMFHIAEGQLGDTVRDDRFERLSSNQGLEALAVTPDGWILAIAEKPRDGAHPMFLVRYSGEVQSRGLPTSPPHYVTGADVGPDGKLYLVLRDYQRLTGVSIHIHRYDLGEDGFPLPETRAELAAFESDSGIDNMEAIALWQDADGVTHLTLLSDDNFNLIQRTLLMDFEVLD